MEILENPAILLIIGATVGIIPAYLSNRQANKHAENMFKVQQQAVYKREFLQKREEAYLEFMEFRAIVSQMTEIMQNDEYTKEQKQNLLLIQAANLVVAI